MQRLWLAGAFGWMVFGSLVNPSIADKEPPKLNAGVVSDPGHAEPKEVPLNLQVMVPKTTLTVAEPLLLSGQQVTRPAPANPKGVLDAKPAAAQTRADVRFQITNTGKEELRLLTTGNGLQLTFEFDGPGKVELQGQTGFDERYRRPSSVTFKPGETLVFTAPALSYVYTAGRQRPVVYQWEKPGKYRMTVRFQTAFAPAPANVKPYGSFEGFGHATLISAPLEFTVEAK